ncbi:NAD-dependent epimerase/dehydratase family protein [Rivularia sp. UHCC 0363]|uniref:NAD-dependent epimerase/dehydratase family protein n=1 Tax=Rivularia sp. UHCC 0363 TaxID=3110244 RepID=UPI002B1FEFF4|nr:NAD-dependent epimerase/dehydratase family protein [Rivularia sp. UHCC 0363]MEA5597459.1 NAD-dependent epimerase/dehydratase family protein [Rivularia sp. UHCC 0363]
MNVTILGCGYVGSAVAQRWQQQGLSVTVTTTRPERLPALSDIANRAVVVQGNDAAALRELLQDQQVLLLSVGAQHRSAYAETYLDTAKTLLQVLPASLQQIIYTGSYAVYGDQQANWVTEASPIFPANENGEILAETERLLLSAANRLRDRLKVCVLRLGGIYGAGRELVKIFSGIAGTTRPGDGSEASNWVHLDDIVGAVEFARAQQLSGIYNLVQEPITTGGLFEQILTKQNLPPVVWDSSQTSSRPYNARVSNQKLRDAGYQFLHPVTQP